MTQKLRLHARPWAPHVAAVLMTTAVFAQDAILIAPDGPGLVGALAQNKAEDPLAPSTTAVARGRNGADPARNGSDRTVAVAQQRLRHLRRSVSQNRDLRDFIVALRPDAPPEQLASTREELIIMNRILNDAAGRLDGGKAAGRVGLVNWFGDPAATGAGMYLDGYGAVFLLKAPYPLAGAPGADGGEKKKGAEDPVWERARGNLSDDIQLGIQIRVLSDLFSGAEARYDSEQVDRLINALIDAVRHASNMKSLRPADRVTVVVQGPGAKAAVAEEGGVDDSGDAEVTTLTIEVKKSDLDAAGTEPLGRKARVSIRDSAGKRVEWNPPASSGGR